MRDNNPVSTTDASSPTPSTASSGTTPNVGWRANPSPYARFDRHEWDALTDRTPLPLTQEDIDQIASLGDPIDMTEVDTIYRPLSALLQLYIDGRRRISAERHAFLGESDAHSTPFVIGIAGSSPSASPPSPASSSSCSRAGTPRPAWTW